MFLTFYIDFLGSARNVPAISHRLILSGANSLWHIFLMKSLGKSAIIRLGTESDDDVFFSLDSIILCQAWAEILLQ